MSKFRKKPVVIEAHCWLKNGDHPNDYDNPVDGFEKGQFITWSGAEARERNWEGQVVRYFRHPERTGTDKCAHCGNTFHVHGWIDTLEGGHIVCPGDWIIKGVKGEFYPVKDDIFAATYEPVEDSHE